MALRDPLNVFLKVLDEVEMIREIGPIRTTPLSSRSGMRSAGRASQPPFRRWIAETTSTLYTSSLKMVAEVGGIEFRWTIMT